MSSVVHRQRKYKQMSLEVAVRNPERYVGILRTFSKFENAILNDENILNIYAQLYIDGVLEWSDRDSSKMSIYEIQNHIKETNKHQNEWGFPTGYQAAFTRYLKTLSEFGFIYSQYNQKLKLSQIAKLVVTNIISMSDALAVQTFKFWRKSPYRRVLNDFNFFKFIYETLFKLKELNKSLSLPQFMVSLFSEDGNVNSFINLLKENKIGNDFNKAYNLVKEKYTISDGKHDKVPKIQTAFNDYGNTVFRVLRLTGLVNVTYAGVILISINESKIDFVKMMLDKEYSITEEAKDDELIYFSEIGTLDQDILNYIKAKSFVKDDTTKNYSKKLESIIKTYDIVKDKLEKSIINTSLGRGITYFSFIPEPIRFEFLLTIYCFISYGDIYNYHPNYKCDEYGIPYSHAPGNMGDIEIFNRDTYWLIEVTLIKNKTQQVNSETVNLFRHITHQSFKEKYLEFVAPYIHKDTEMLIKAGMLIAISEKRDTNLYCKTTKIDDFINECNKRNNIYAIKQYSKNTILKVKQAIDNYKFK